MTKNKFGLVYQNALTDNVPGQVNRRPVYYQNFFGLTIAANLYTPAGFDKQKKYPAVIAAHPNGGVKEQVAGLFAQGLAKNGYVAIAYDAAYQGASEGNPRQSDLPPSAPSTLGACVATVLKMLIQTTSNSAWRTLQLPARSSPKRDKSTTSASF